jgi:hypothetical protein
MPSRTAIHFQIHRRKIAEWRLVFFRPLDRLFEPFDDFGDFCHCAFASFGVLGIRIKSLEERQKS